MLKNFIKTISNPELFTPTIYLAPEVVEYEEKTIIHVRVPVSTAVAIHYHSMQIKHM